ncbi:MAG: putative metal-binding motif-containing protein [Kofleriaceae bacterium]
MRALIFVLLVGACTTEEGANLTFSGGPAGVASYEVVLASPDAVAMIPDQRVSPLGVTSETVTYYLQRRAANAGAIQTIDGYRVLIEPSATVSETSFIPFVLFYDAQQRVIGVGAYHPNGAGPSPIEVKRSEVDLYTIEVETVTEDVDTKAVGSAGAMQVMCGRTGGAPFRSGVVWRDANGGELRLMLPSDGSTDATMRPLDLDCDGEVVATAASSEDCDDTRARFHTGATEVCNGEDTNCDAAPYSVVSCTSAPSCGNSTTGTAVCDQTTRTVGTCSTDVTCACAPDSTVMSECRKCVLDFAHGTGAGTVSVCEPAIDAMIDTQGACSAAPCTVEVVATTGGWDASVAATSQSSFAKLATGVTSAFALRVARVDPNLATAASVGTVSLVVTTSTGPRLFDFDLELAAQIGTCTGSNGSSPMSCQ